MNILKCTFPKRYGGNIRIFLKNITMNSKIKKIVSEKKEFIQIKNSFIQNLRQWRNKKIIY